MAVALASAAGNTEDINLSGGDIVLGAPASTAAGDTRVHWIIQVVGGVPANGTGMTSIGTDIAFDTGVNLVWKIATGSEGSITHATPGADVASAGYAFRVTGAHATTPINVSVIDAFAGTTSPQTLPTVTTTVPNCKIVYCLFGGDAQPSMAVPALYDRFWNAGVELGGIWSEDQVSAGTTTARQVTWTGSNGCHYAIIAIAPAADTFTGTVAVTLGSFTAAGSGTTTPPAVTGTAAVTLASFTAAASGTVNNDRTGTANPVLASFTVTATGTVSPPAITGTVAVTLGSFTSAADGFATIGRWPTAVSSNGRWIEDQHGDPWPVFGDSNIVIHTVPLLTADEVATGKSVESYLDELEAHGFNAMWTKFVYQASGGIVYENVDGDEPFVGTIFQTALNAPYWDHWEAIFEMAAERGITIFVFPTWAGFDDSEGDRVAMEAATGVQMEAYGAAIGARFAPYLNLIWMNTGDRPSPTGELVSRWKSVQDGIIGAGATQLWGMQGTRGVLHTTYISTNSMAAHVLDLNTIYQDAADPTGDAAAAWGEDIGPTISYEMQYRNDPTSPTLDRLRLQTWGMFCAGANGQVIGNKPRWHMDTVAAEAVAGVSYLETWDDPDGDDDRDTDDFTVFAAFVAGLGGSFATMVPDRTDTFLTAGEGTGVTRSAARFDGASTAGVMAVVYRPHGGSATLTFDLTEFTAVPSVRIRKLDPISGAYTTIGTFATSGSQAVGSLGNNSSGDNDWVLVVEQTDDRTGTVAVTLGSFTSDASGSTNAPAFTGTVAVTLAAFTAAGVGTVTPPPITGTVAVTLDVFAAAGTGTASGAGEIDGGAAITLDPFTALATGTTTPPAIVGTVAVTLGLFIATAFEAFQGATITGPLAVRAGGPNRRITPAATARTVTIIDGGRAPA